MPAADPTNIERWLRLILAPGQVTELRALNVVTGYGAPQTISGYYNDPAKLAKDAAGISRATGIYFIPNAVNPNLLARAVNKCRPVGKSETTSDTHIVARRWLLIDTDAVRPAGIAATDEEHAAAKARTIEIADQLSKRGWPVPIAADSGNGGHLLYRIDLPPDDGGLVQRCLTALAARFDDAAVKIDTSVYNPARIWKLYGTLAGKGDADAAAIGRPHRLSQVLSVPDELQVVTREQLEALGGALYAGANDSPQLPRAAGSFDLDAFIRDHGLDVTGPESWNGAGRRWVFNVCPWNPDHTDKSAFIAQLPNGAISAGCHHNGCQGKGWPELRIMFDRGYAERRHQVAIEQPCQAAERGDYADEESALSDEPQPLPESLMRAPGFVSEVMDYCLSTAPYPNVALAFCGALCLQAVLAGRKVRDPHDNRTNLYLLGLAHSSAGKDWPRKLNTRILNEVGMLKCLGDKFASAEGLQDALYVTPSMLFQNDEIDGLLEMINKSREARFDGLMSALLTLYSSANSIYPMRRKAGQAESLSIDQPCLVLFGTAIPDHYYDALSGRMLTNGFLARWITVESGKRVAGQDAKIIDVPPRVLESARWWADYRPGGGNLEHVHPTAAVVEYSDEARRTITDARASYDAEYARAEELGDATAMTVWGRANEHVRKLALTYAVSESAQSPKIGPAAVKWAHEFVTRQSQRLLFKSRLHVADNPFHEQCQRFKRLLAKAKERTALRSRLLKAMHTDAQTFDRIAQTLAQSGDVAIEERQTATRPATAYRLLRA